MGYRPECDLSKLCSEDDGRIYLSLIGVIHWMLELGGIYFTCEVSMLASFCAMTREGHLYQLFHIFSYLKKYHNSRMVFDLTYPEIDVNLFLRKEWRQNYAHAKEVIPSDCPRPLGK